MNDFQEPFSDRFPNGSHSTTSKEITILLEGELNIVHNKHIIPVHLLVTSHYLKYAPIGKDNHIAGKEIIIDWGHVTGCHCLRGKLDATGKNAYFSIYIYAPKNGKRTQSTKSSVLKRCVLTFEINNEVDNMKLAKEYQSVILSCIHMSNATPFKDKKPYLVLVNPKSGPGKAYQIFTNIVNPIFGEADIPYELLITEYSGHAFEEMRTLNTSLYKGIVVVSGDGLVHEVINGLFSRSNWSEVLKSCPIGVIAAGSGNALAASLCHSSGLSSMESVETHTALILVSPRIHPIDLVAVETSSGKKLLSFLSVTWGLVANVDIESEKWRSLGNARFTLAAVGLILKNRCYPATLSFLPHGEAPYRFNRQRINTLPSLFPSNNRDHRLSVQLDQSLTGSNSSSTGGVTRGQLTRSESLPPMPSHNNPSANYKKDIRRLSSQKSIEENNSVSYTLPEEWSGTIAEEDERYLEEEVFEKANSPSDSTNHPLHQENIEGSDSTNHPLHQENIEGSGDDKCATISTTPHEEENDQSKIQFQYCPPLDSPVPDNWQTLTDEFITVVAVYLSHLSTDAVIVSNATMTDGIIHLVIIRRGMKRNQLVQLFTKMEQGENIDGPYVDIVPVKAFRLCPYPATKANTVISVDGELVEYGDIQGEILPSAGCILGGPDIKNNEGINGPLSTPKLEDSLKDSKTSRNKSQPDDKQNESNNIEHK